MNPLPFALALCLSLCFVAESPADGAVILELAENAVVWLDGQPSRLEDFPEGVEIEIGRDPDGKVGFILGTSPLPAPPTGEPWVFVKHIRPAVLWRQRCLVPQ